MGSTKLPMGYHISHGTSHGTPYAKGRSISFEWPRGCPMGCQSPWDIHNPMGRHHRMFTSYGTNVSHGSPQDPIGQPMGYLLLWDVPWNGSRDFPVPWDVPQESNRYCCNVHHPWQEGPSFPGLFTGHAPTRGSGQKGFKMSRVGSGRVRRCSESHGWGQVGSRGFQISRVRSGRVKRFSNLTGRVESGHEVLKMSRVGSGRVMTCEVRVIRGSGHHDPRVVIG